MTLFGGTKGYQEHKKEREEEAIDGLSKKLKKEIKRREGAEREVERLKKEVRTLKEIAIEYIKDDGIKPIYSN